MSADKTTTLDHPADARRMQLRYGFNEVDCWWHISIGPDGEQIRRRLRLMGTRVIRVFVFDKPVPDPMTDWYLFAGYVQAVLDAGAVPMITFAKYHPPHEDPRNLRTYVERTKEVVWSCLDQWGSKIAHEWYWCVWNEPNNYPVGGALNIPLYCHIYREVAGVIHRLLEPHLDGRKARIGGPAVDGFIPFWLDWISALVNDVDEKLVGFVAWHHYGDWRPVVPGATLGVNMDGAPDTPPGVRNETLLIAQTPAYEARARAVARVIAGRDILNVCGEVNTIVNHKHAYVGGLNQNAFGAAYYTSALIHLLRGGADVEMRWTATGYDDAYGLMSMKGEPMHAGLAKQIFAQHVRYGDWIRFPVYRPEVPNLDAVVAWDDSGRRSGAFVHTGSGPCVVTVADWDQSLKDCDAVLRIDSGTGERVVREPFKGTISFAGYGMAVVTNAAKDTVLD
jgi:hypothetical protein